MFYTFLAQNWQEPGFPDFCNKWSWGFVVVPPYYHAYKKNKYAQFSSSVTYLVSLSRKNFGFLGYLLIFGPKMARSGYLDFCNEWSWDFCVMPLYCHTHKRNKYAHLSSSVTNLVSLTRYNLGCSGVYTFLANNWQDQATPTFVINGHGASLLCRRIITPIKQQICTI